MLSIGEISKICRISTKALRHYDRINLIKPSYINEENGYRYYSANQVRDITFINKMKTYEFSLNEISEMLKSKNNIEIQKKLELKIKELQTNTFKLEFAISQIYKDISNIKRGFDIMSNEFKVKIVERKPCNIVSIRRYMGIKDFEKAYEDLFEIVEKNKYTICGPSFAIYHSEDFDRDNTEIETCFPIEEKQGENVRVYNPGKCCMTTLIGPYIDFSPAYVALESWLENSNYKISSPPFEEYVKGMDSEVSQNEMVTEIYFPITDK